jgi:hypothetical protein
MVSVVRPVLYTSFSGLWLENLKYEVSIPYVYTICRKAAEANNIDISPNFSGPNKVVSSGVRRELRNFPKMLLNPYQKVWEASFLMLLKCTDCFQQK